jgi:nucleotide-binding universal stress UspA family protein
MFNQILVALKFGPASIHALKKALELARISEKISMGRLDYVGVTILENSPCPVMLVPYNKTS